MKTCWSGCIQDEDVLKCMQSGCCYILEVMEMDAGVNANEKYVASAPLTTTTKHRMEKNQSQLDWNVN